MMRRSPIVALILVVGVLLACKKKAPTPTGPVSTTGPGATVAPTTIPEPIATSTGGSATGTKGDLAETRALLQKFLAPGADTAALTRTLEPAPGDYAAVFGADAAKAQAYYAKMWKDPKAEIRPNAGQTQLLLFGTTTDLVSSDREFPGGYAKVKLQKGLPIYRWKFVEPGKTLGMAYDGLVFVNGHFAFFPKPWRALE